MANRNVTLVSCALLSLLSAATTPAAPLLTNNSCSVLGEVVRQAAVDAVLVSRGYGVTGGSPMNLLGEPLSSCHDTASAVTTGFAEGLSQLGIHIQWLYGATGDQPVCPARNISKCNPFIDPMGPTVAMEEAQAVAGIWRRIRDGVALTMPWGTASNMSFFRAASLAVSLRRMPDAAPVDVGMSEEAH